MTNWTEFVKKFAKDNNTTYGCALSNPDCSAEYRQKYGVKKPLGKNKEKQLMGAEDINVASSRPPKKTPERKQQLSSMKQKLNKKNTQKQLVETIGMIGEDINSRGLRPPTTPLVQDIAGNFVDVPIKTEGSVAKRKGGRKKGSKNKSKAENITMVIEEIKENTKRSRGRPKKYATTEDARKAKIANTIAGAKRRKEAKGGSGVYEDITNFAKKVFKKTNPVEYALISGASNIVQNPEAVIYGRNDYPPKVREIINTYGNKNIISVTLGRTPLGKPLMTALQLASGNTFSQRLSNTPYDKLFHLFACLEFADGSKIMIEKNEVINAGTGCKLPKETETKSITSTSIPTALTLNDALEKTREFMGKNYFTYSAKDNNCQDFITSFLKANNIGDETDTSWVKQETKVLFEGNDRLRKIANTLTDIGASFDVITQGAGLKPKVALLKKKKVGGIIMPPPNEDEEEVEDEPWNNVMTNAMNVFVLQPLNQLLTSLRNHRRNNTLTPQVIADATDLTQTIYNENENIIEHVDNPLEDDYRQLGDAIENILNPPAPARQGELPIVNAIMINKPPPSQGAGLKPKKKKKGGMVEEEEPEYEPDTQAYRAIELLRELIQDYRMEIRQIQRDTRMTDTPRQNQLKKLISDIEINIKGLKKINPDILTFLKKRETGKGLSQSSAQISPLLLPPRRQEIQEPSLPPSRTQRPLPSSPQPIVFTDEEEDIRRGLDNPNFLSSLSLKTKLANQLAKLNWLKDKSKKLTTLQRQNIKYLKNFFLIKGGGDDGYDTPPSTPQLTQSQGNTITQILTANQPIQQRNRALNLYLTNNVRRGNYRFRYGNYLSGMYHDNDVRDMLRLYDRILAFVSDDDGGGSNYEGDSGDSEEEGAGLKPKKKQKNSGKGLAKKSTTNTKMPNKWITYVKDYAKKHNMKYNDALKDPKMKAGYKTEGSVAKSGGEIPDAKYFKTPPEEEFPDAKYFRTPPAKKRLLPFEPKQQMLEGSGLPSSRSEYIAQLYNQANLGANGRVNL